MSPTSRVLDLVVAWEELRSAGREPSLEELCSDCPELLEELRESLAAVAGMDAVLKTDEPPKHAQAGPAPNLAKPSAIGSRRDHWPVLPQYEILEELGRGGMGIVFKARHESLGRIVALKTILGCGSVQEDQVRRFLREARAMALLQHPNIVQIYEIGQHGEHPFLAMEYVPGENLACGLGGNPWPPRKAAELVATLARAVQVAHDQGILHRDLKPTNILLAADGTPKICDFGLAKPLGGDADQTRTGQLLGTPSYMAPEQVRRGPDSQGPAVDIHALGIVLYEALTGHPPYLADNPLDTLQLVTGQEPVPPRRSQPKIPRDLETICLKCLAKDPSRRYPRAADLADDLGRFLAHERVHARPLGPLGRSVRWCRAHPSRAALVGVALVAMLVLLAVVLGYNRRLAQELQRTNVAHREVLEVQEKLRHTLLQEAAEWLDGDLRQLASVPRTMAALLGDRDDSQEARLEQVVKQVLTQTPRIFGVCVAFEPFAWKKGQRDFALYIYRKSDALAVTQLLPPAYQPLYRDWEWYRAAQESPQGRWSEPYVDASGDQVPMVTFSAPIRRSGRFVGVVTIDLAADYFRELRGSLDRLDWGRGSHYFLVSAGQRILSHALDRYEFPAPDCDLTRLPLDESVRRLMSRWGQVPAGMGPAVDFSTGRPATFRFSRVSSAGWTLVNVTE